MTRSLRRTLARAISPPETRVPDPVASELAALHAKVDRLTDVVERLAAGQKQDGKWRGIFRRQMSALIRAQFIGSLAAPHVLSAHGFRLYSQSDEDGIVLALLRAAGVSNRVFVEIGCGGTGGNSAILAQELGWCGVMIDSSDRAISAVEEVFRSRPGVTIIKKTVTTDTLNRIIKSAVPDKAVDFLSIDVDSIDYWLLEAIRIPTRVLVMEYNAHFGPERSVTVPNAPRPQGAPKGYSGASLTAITRAAARKGYRLVLCEDAGVNAFFVRDDLAPQVPTLTPAEAFKPLQNKYDATGESLRHRDLYAEIASRGLPLVEV